MKQQIKLSPDVKITFGDKPITDLYTQWFVQWVNKELGETVFELKNS